MTAINKFNKSMIYTIRSPHTDKYYIGSTTQKLCKRFVDHKTNYNEYLKGLKHFVTSYKIIELGESYIELFEEFNCENRLQLQRREGEIQRDHKAHCVNRCIAGRTQKEWEQDNHERISIQNKEYKLLHSDKIKQDNKEYMLRNADKIKQYRLQNAEKLKEQKKQYYAENKEKLKEKRRAKNAEKKLLKDLESITI